MSASMTAFFHAHVVEEAGRVILERGLLPAAYRKCGQEPPAAPFDTFTGDGVGKLNNVPGATIHFVFVDAGEPGKEDTASIIVTDANGNIVLNVSGFINVGNIQAHDDGCD